MEEEKEDILDQPSQEDVDTITELQIAKKKYIRRMETMQVPSSLGKGKVYGGDARSAQVINSMESIDALVGYFEKFKRLKPSQVFFAKKLIRNAAHMELKNLERSETDE